jgi:hypothetical protein
MPRINFSVCSLSPGTVKKYQLFARKNFKSSGYQFNFNYLKHLYLENPFSEGMSDCRIILKKEADQSEVVGCIHNITSILTSSNIMLKSIKFSSIHNLMVDKDNLGIGYKLLSDVIRRHKNFYVPGVIGDLNNFYLKIGAKQLTNIWHRKFVISNFFQSVLRIRGIKISHSLLAKFQKKYLSADIQLHYERSDKLVNIISNELDSIDLPRLSLKYIFWRIFGTNNPDKQTFILTLDQDYAVFSIGCRKYFPILRLIYVSNRASGNVKLLTNAIVPVARAFGAIGIFSTSDNLSVTQQLQALKFKELKNSPKSYFYSKDYNNFYTPHWPMMGDYGFDEFFTSD